MDSELSSGCLGKEAAIWSAELSLEKTRTWKLRTAKVAAEKRTLHRIMGPDATLVPGRGWLECLRWVWFCNLDTSVCLASLYRMLLGHSCLLTWSLCSVIGLASMTSLSAPGSRVPLLFQWQSRTRTYSFFPHCISGMKFLPNPLPQPLYISWATDWSGDSSKPPVLGKIIPTQWGPHFVPQYLWICYIMWQEVDYDMIELCVVLIWAVFSRLSGWTQWLQAFL